jgi:hypothetical protein
VNELQLHARLGELADDLAPAADPYAQVAAARSLHRRQRRTRLAVGGLAAAVGAVVIGVPTVVGALSSPGGSDGVAPAPVTPSPSAAPGTPAPTPRDRDEVRVDEALADQRLDESDTALGAGLQQMAAALVARPAPLELVAPAGTGGCPDTAGALESRLGTAWEPAGGSLSAGALGCRWTTGDGTTIGIGTMPIANPRKPLLDAVNRLPPSDCATSAMPNTEQLTAFSGCTVPEGTDWSLYVLDPGGAVTVVLTAVVPSGNPADGPAVVAELVEVADGLW